jgi:uncharacterized protein
MVTGTQSPDTVAQGEHDLRVLLASMEPVRHSGSYVFTVDGAGSVPSAEVVAMVREPEGVSLVVSETSAIRLALPVHFRCAWITLTVHSALNAVGLTAAVSTALAAAGISCNVVAGTYHDHLFVPASMADAAMHVLRDLQRSHTNSV